MPLPQHHPSVIPTGPNKLQQALEDYDLLVSENAHLNSSLKEYVDLSNKLAAENEALKGQIKTQGDFLVR